MAIFGINGTPVSIERVYSYGWRGRLALFGTVTFDSKKQVQRLIDKLTKLRDSLPD